MVVLVDRLHGLVDAAHLPGANPPRWHTVALAERQGERRGVE